MISLYQQKFFFNVLLYPFLQFSLTNVQGLYIYIDKKGLKYIMTFLKNHTYFKNYLMDLIIIDYPQNLNRFKVVYTLLSYKNNIRLNIVTYTNEIVGLDSISYIYPSSVWLERESWDMFGVCFFNHPDLRRIFTDYGFYGFALRKDFPLTGFSELQYDFNQKRIVSNPISLSQEIRLFNYTSSWLKYSTRVKSNSLYINTQN